MLRSLFTVFLNNLLRRKYISLINIIGLVLGFSCFMLLLLYVHHENSYDDYNKNIENVSRIRYKISQNNIDELDIVVCSPAVGPTLKNEIPEVLEFVRFLRDKDNIISYNNLKFKEKNVFYVDSSIFKVFTFDFIQGDPITALNEPYSAVISDLIAKKYFGEENPIGKVIKKNNNQSFTVTGVFKSLDAKSHIKIDILYSFNSDHWLSNDLNSWNRSFFYTYLLLQKGSDYEKIESQIEEIANRNRSEIDQEKKWTFILQPLNTIHLHSDFRAELENNGNGKVVTILFFVAFLILLIAWVNYINLSIALSMERAKEVGIKKVVGFFKKELLQQFIFESFIINLFSFVIALIFVSVLINYFNSLLNIHLSLSTFPTNYWLLIILVLLIGAILSSLYSGWRLASFNPTEVIKGKFVNSGRGNSERKILLILQYVISISLIIGSITYFKQINYMLHDELGVNIEDKLILDGFKVSKMDSITTNSINSFKSELLNEPSIKGVTLSNSVPVLGGGYGVRIRKISQEDKAAFMCGVMHVDEDFLTNYDIRLVAGKNFSGNSSNQNNIIISEKAAKMLGFNNIDESLGVEITREYWGNGNCKIIGVTKNFKTTLKNEQPPLMFHYSKNEKQFVSISLGENIDFPYTLKFVSEKWQYFFPEETFNYYILSDEYKQSYKSELQQGKIILLFTIISIVLSCIGLIGLSSLVITQRSKEVSLRKVLGQDTYTILFVLYKYFLFLTIIASLVAIPVTYYLLNKWLENYAFHIKLSPVYGLIGLSISIIITVITISYFSIKTVRTNPASILREE